jgi:succinate-acetate transporter protein
MSSDELTRNGTTVTMQLSPEQYERLFFQPEKPKGDLSQRLGNPTLLGVMGFVIPFQTTMWCLLQFKGADATSLVAISGSWYFIGGICMSLAGICEFILGNTFPFAAFVVYGCHWINQAYTGDPSHHFLSAYADGALSKPWNSGSGHYNVVMAVVSFVFLLGSLRTNVPFVVVFLTLAIVFGFLAAADYQIGYHPDPEGLAYAAKLLKIGGGFGFVSAIMGWYLAIITVCASTGVPCPLPIFDLSQRVFPHSKAQIGEHAGAQPA